MVLFPVPANSVNGLLAPDEDLGLTVEEKQELDNFQSALRILDQAAGAVLMCPGNQENIADEDKCPYSSKYPLLRMYKAPADKMCPVERTRKHLTTSSLSTMIDR
jgi:hypothetical protein